MAQTTENHHMYTLLCVCLTLMYSYLDSLFFHALRPHSHTAVTIFVSPGICHSSFVSNTSERVISLLHTTNSFFELHIVKQVECLHSVWLIDNRLEVKAVRCWQADSHSHSSGMQPSPTRNLLFLLFILRWGKKMISKKPPVLCQIRTSRFIIQQQIRFSSWVSNRLNNVDEPWGGRSNSRISVYDSFCGQKKMSRNTFI